MEKRLPLQEWVRLIGVILTAVVVLLILYFSFLPPGAAPTIGWLPFADKGAHMLAYAAYGFSSFLATLKLPGTPQRKPRRRSSPSVLHISSWSGSSIIISLVSGTALGALVELIQPTFGRSREWMDLVADFMGLVVGLAAVLVVIKLLGAFFISRPWLYDPNWKEDLDESGRTNSRRTENRSSRA